MKKVSNRPWGAAALVLVCGFAGAASAQPVLTNLGALPGFDYAWAEGLSPDGTAVTGFLHAAGGSEVFRWTRAGGMQSLGILPGALASAPGRIPRRSEEPTSELQSRGLIPYG